MTLNDLKTGERGRVKNIAGHGSLHRRLLELGIHRGITITMIKSAPLKDPLEISLGNGHLSLRRTEAALITIEPVD
jgi:ferrous iron transport protein B